MNLILTVIVSGLLIGVVYAAIAAGFSIALGSCRVVNFAHGQFVVFAAYGTYSLRDVLPLYAGGVLMVLLAFAVGYVLHRQLLDPLGRGDPPTQIVVTVAIAMILESIVALAYGTNGVSAEGAWPSGRTVDVGITIDLARVVGAVIAAGLLLALAEFLNRNRWGLAVRAAGDNIYGCELTGYSGREVLSFGFGVATAMAAAAGVLLLPVFDFAPFDGLVYTLLAFIVVVVGGAGNLRGAIVVGLAYGVLESLMTYWFSADAARVSLFVAMLAAIGVRSVIRGPISARAVTA
jgi:branched-chain amino acid transport system permease protein